MHALIYDSLYDPPAEGPSDLRRPFFKGGGELILFRESAGCLADPLKEAQMHGVPFGDGQGQRCLIRSRGNVARRMGFVPDEPVLRRFPIWLFSRNPAALQDSSKAGPGYRLLRQVSFVCVKVFTIVIPRNNLPQ